MNVTQQLDTLKALSLTKDEQIDTFRRAISAWENMLSAHVKIIGAKDAEIAALKAANIASQELIVNLKTQVSLLCEAIATLTGKDSALMN